MTRRDYFALIAGALAKTARAENPHQPTETLPAAEDDAIAKTHAALFDMWFPLSELPLNPAIVPDIGKIAAEVQAGMLAAFQESAFLSLLEGMTFPQALPFYECLAASTNSAIRAFVSTPGGFGAMPAQYREGVFSYLFEGSCGPASVQTGQILREGYLSGIWDLPLAVPLAEFQAPTVFMANPDIYAKRHAPRIPKSRLAYDAASHSIRHTEGPIDYLIIGSGPGGAATAYNLQRSGKRVVLIEKGPFVVWGSMTTRSYPTLMYAGDRASTTNNGVIIRSGETLGGGSTVNIDLAFSPLESTILNRIRLWVAEGLLDARYYSVQQLSAAYEWVREKIGTREVFPSELNRDNLALYNGARAYGVDPKLYHLNRFAFGASPSPVNDKLDAARQLLLDPMQDSLNPLSVITDASVDEILFAPISGGSNVRAMGARLTIKAPWTEYGNTVVDASNLQIPPGTTVSIDAQNIILAAGTIGTSRILLNTAKSVPLLANPRIGKGIILHPSFPLLGLFNETINLLEGLDSASFVDAFGVSPGYIFETMAGLPAYGALLVPGNGKQIFEQMSLFNDYAGFGVMLVDTPSDDNAITLDAQGNPQVAYTLSEGDKQRFRIGIGAGIRMMFLGGARQVIVPSNENVLGLSGFDPMKGVFLTSIDQADLVEKNLQFIPNRTVLTSAHLQATNKIGPLPDKAVVSLRQRVWNTRGEEVPNLYVMDSSIFPTSVGANPMQSLYTFGRIFSERLIRGIDEA